MISVIHQELGPWIWLIIGALLLIGEIKYPGKSLIWPAMAANSIGAVLLSPFVNTAEWSWIFQFTGFVILTIAFLILNRVFSNSTK